MLGGLQGSLRAVAWPAGGMRGEAAARPGRGGRDMADGHQTMEKAAYQRYCEERETGRCRGRGSRGTETYIWREEGGEYKGRRKNRGERLPRWRAPRGNIACWTQAPSNHATISSIASPSSSTSVSPSPRSSCRTSCSAAASSCSSASSSLCGRLRGHPCGRQNCPGFAQRLLWPAIVSLGQPARCPAPPRRSVDFAVTYFPLPWYVRYVPPTLLDKHLQAARCVPRNPIVTELLPAKNPSPACFCPPAG